MRKQIVFGFVVAVVAATASVAAAAPCSIHPSKGASDAQVTSLATLSQADAEKIALARVKTPATAAGAELGAERGCLIWTFDLKLAGKSGAQEVQVDAGNGKVLSVKHESARHEATEAAKEPAATKKP